MFWKRNDSDRDQAKAYLDAVESAAIKLGKAIDLKDSGRLKMATLGGIDELHVLYVMVGLHDNWTTLMGNAIRSNRLEGRGYVILDQNANRIGYVGIASNDNLLRILPREIETYCRRYDPAREVVIAAYGFPQQGLPRASAALWVRPTDAWSAPNH